jgi:hypothetical protein
MKKQLFIMFLVLMASCSYDQNPLIENAGYLEGEIETYTGASKIRPVAGVKVTTLPSSLEAISNEDGKFYIDNIAAGDYIVKLQLKDHYGAYLPAVVLADKKNEISCTILPYDPTNIAPIAPKTPYPQSNGSVYDTALVIAWTCSDPDSNPIYYDVYFSEQNPPRKCIKYAQREKNSVKVSGLKTGTTYYWQVKVRDYPGAEVFSDVWNFKVKTF